MPPPTPSTDDAVCDAIRAWAAASPVHLCVLFGSRGAGRSGPGADVDVAIEFASLPPPERRLQIIGQLQAAAGAVPVDVVFLHRDTDPVLRFEVFRSGRLLFEATPGLFVEGRVRAVMLYQDALPFRRALREHLRRTARQGPPLVP